MAFPEHLSSDYQSLLTEKNTPDFHVHQQSSSSPPTLRKPVFARYQEFSHKSATSGTRHVTESGKIRIKRAGGLQLTAWYLDAVALLCAIACILILLIVLLRFDDKPVPNWSGVTINTLISILGDTIKATLAYVLTNALGQLKWLWFWNESKPGSVMDYQLFDDAGRGPLGSLLILIKKLKWKLYSLGAIITVVMVAFLPFLQQIPTYPSRLVSMNDTATINRNTYYQGWNSYPLGNGHSGNRFFLNSAIKGSYYAGLFRSSGEDTTLTPVCPGGNCTFSPYTSLGVCSACQDVKSLLKAPEKLTPSFNFWSLPNGVTANPSFDLMEIKSADTLVFQNLANYTVLDATSIHFTPGTGMTGGTPSGAYECVLYLCVQKYRANVSQGIFSEELISIWPEHDVSNSSAAQGIQMPSVNLTDIAEAQDGDQSSGNMTITAPNDPSLYKIDVFTFALMRKWLATAGASYVSTSTSNAPNDTSQVFLDGLSSNSCPDNNDQTCNRMDAIMSRVASSMTNSIRIMGEEVAKGSGQSVETFLKVRWEWVILPIIMIVLTFAFFVSTVYINKVHHVPVWKSSSLPLMAYGLQREAGQAISAHGPGLDSLEKAAKQYHVTMERNGQPIGLVAR